MKFLILQKSKHVPVEIWAKLFPAHFKYLDNLEKEGKIEISYHLIGQQGTLLIVKVDSEEELTRIIGDDPLFFYSEREIYPLTTREDHKKYLKQIIGER
ncbi:MAG: YciI family protein [Candidatus Bathyarchaeota archaeon]|nr:YciI family protein [Candidatus Bathyarchaeota archaeon]MDH5636185.1 YciI family protein [Candidatus Bathyarchaeota archaeon]MDH5702387.1 YciI family protein [Candidatus Bathyarchaeota archaeon]